ncbi:long-chain fatty acid--CoA ligase [Streptomyces sp. LHD-70]|uniref:long-chain-fatty-acid--CoA ligase n=1 Tax=Streptomyces sp. LHD-70 TaxID=3072140 RepID=UPI00280FAF4A|nr:long-chain fatty acid--CoA ligase [Streptomyces sp. LHD-70]MDQ8706154.1 long-chain fatty acid--CoA ligase [Streptomyces sp. LHD-70]
MTHLSLATVLAEAARRRPDHPALVEDELRITFAELWQQARTQAAALTRLGVRPGDKVALMAPNTAEFPRAYYAILAAGAVVVPVHLLLTAEEAAHVLRDSGARLLLCHAAQTDTGSKAAAEAGVRMIALGPEVSVAGSDGRLEDLAQTVEPLPSYTPRAAEDLAVVFYTSGTTGVPKGVGLSHLNLVMNATVNAFDINDVRPDDVVLGALPLFHVFGQTVSMNSTWRAGATFVLLPRFDAAAAVELMVREGVNTFHGVPTMYIRLLEAARTAGALPRLRLCISGGASLPVTVLERFNEVFDTEVYEGYGLSETSPTTAVNQPDFGARAGTVGHPVWGVEVEIARADLEEQIELLPFGDLGEIVVRGHNVFSGYLGRPEDTAAALVDGWFRTGDLGRKDADGFISIVDRKKDLIIRGGFNVYPRQVEEVLLRHPGIAEAAVIGVPDSAYGEEVCAVLIADRHAAPAPTAEDVTAWARQHLAKHMYPRRIEFVDAFPLGPSHKVLKRELRQRFG